MGLNPSISQQSPSQIAKRTFDSDNDSVRVSLGDTTGLAIELSAADGDSVEAQVRSLSSKTSLTNASTGFVVAAFDVKDLKKFNLYSKTTSTVVGSQALTLQISPHDSDDVWISTTLIITPSTVNGTIISGTELTAMARRARVSIAAAITSGTIDLYFIGQG